MDAFDWQAGIIERAARALAYWVETTSQERLDWCPEAHPESKARCVSDQIRECIEINRKVAAALNGTTFAGNVRPAETTAANGADLAREVMASGKEFADAVRSMTDASMNRKHDIGFGDYPSAALVELATGNMYYHGGQLNYIETLYGDTVFRFPGPDYQPGRAI